MIFFLSSEVRNPICNRDLNPRNFSKRTARAWKRNRGFFFYLVLIVNDITRLNVKATCYRTHCRYTSLVSGFSICSVMADNGLDIVSLHVEDVRFPTSLQADGSDAMVCTFTTLLINRDMGMALTFNQVRDITVFGLLTVK